MINSIKDSTKIWILYLAIITFVSGCQFSRPSSSTFVQAINNNNPKKLIELIEQDEPISQEQAEDFIKFVKYELGEIETPFIPKGTSGILHQMSLGKEPGEIGSAEGYSITGTTEHTGELLLNYCGLFSSKPCGITVYVY